MTDRTALLALADKPTPPPLRTHHAELPSWQGWHYIWYPELQRSTHLMSKSAASNLAACFKREGARVYRHPDAPVPIAFRPFRMVWNALRALAGEAQ